MHSVAWRPCLCWFVCQCLSSVRDMLNLCLILSHVGFESRLREVCEELLGPPHRYWVFPQLFFLPGALLLPREKKISSLFVMCSTLKMGTPIRLKQNFSETVRSRAIELFTPFNCSTSSRSKFAFILDAWLDYCFVFVLFFSGFLFLVTLRGVKMAALKWKKKIKRWRFEYEP